MGRHHATVTRSSARPTRTGAEASANSTRSLPRMLLAIGLLIAALATAVGLIVQWPSNEAPPVSPEFTEYSGQTGELVEGTVAFVHPGMCNSPSLGKAFEGSPINQPSEPQDCTHAIVDITDGPDAGKRTLLEVRPETPGSPNLQAGDEILLTTHVANGGYGFQDFQRSTTMWIWVAAALLLIAVVGAWRGVRSIVGLAITMVVVALFLIPGLTHGGSPVLLALTCGSAVLFFVMFLVHGFSWKTASAMGGTLLALGLSVVLSALAVSSAGIRGLGDENNLQILLYLPGVSISGLMLAGMIVGALGVLNDVTIAQASTVNELHELDPQASTWHLFASAMKVGRDHIASMVYTLVLSYTGVALPTLMLLSVSGRPLAQTLTSDIMATEILRSVTGAIALVLAVPLTTAIAAATVMAKASAQSPQHQEPQHS